MSRLDEIKTQSKQAVRDTVEDYLAKKRDYESTFGTPEGRRVLLDLLTRASFFRTNGTGNSKQYTLEGQREFVLGFQAFIPAIMGQVINDRYADEENRIRHEFVTQGGVYE